MEHEHTAPERMRSQLWAAPGWAGLAVAALFWWESLVPTLIPRPAVAQGLVSAVCVAAGYGIGVAISGGVRALYRGRHLKEAVLRGLWIAVAVVWLAVVIVGLPPWLVWQNDQRDLMGMDRVGAGEAGIAFVVTLIGTAVWVLLGRLIGRGLRALTVRLLRVVDEVVATVLIVVLLVAAGSWVIGGAAWRGAPALANSIFSVSNGDTTEGVRRPTSAAVSGSAASLVSWESLGRTGRDFAGGVTTPAQLAAFAGPDAEITEPVRAYVGVESADTVQERAELAVRELERAGGFERSVLVVWTPTGSGWMIAEAATALEQMYGGDTAIVGIQYSFLPSILAVFMYDGYAEKAGAALFTAVEERWRQLPTDSRPKLLVFGKSLGTTGAETPSAAYDASSSVGNMLARTDGALIVGARKGNTILS